MIKREEKRDLLTVPQGYYLAHCISGDYSLGAGLAAKINELYDMSKKLNVFFPYVDTDEYLGNALLVDNVFNLVVKTDRYQQSSYYMLRKALEDMRRDVEHLKIRRIAIPKFGCGYDRLEWSKVSLIINEVFADVDVYIFVCSM